MVSSESFAPATAPLHGVVRVPGSKSVSNRALVCAALAPGESRLTGVASGDDTIRMVAGLQQLGADIEVGGDTVQVRRAIGRASRDAVVIDAGLAGTTSRFLSAVAALRVGESTITGDAGLLRRPMGELHRLLRDIGANITSEREGFLPVTIVGAPERNAGPTAEITARGDVSSQFISALMMIAPLLRGLRINVSGAVVSRGYLAMTADVMASFGVAVQLADEVIVVPAGPYRADAFHVDADWSSASYPFAAVAIAGGEVTVPGLRSDSAQPEAGFVDVLARMGCTVSEDATGVMVSRDAQRPLIGVDVDMAEMSDLVPTLAAIAACATSPTRIRGVGFIRAKESDRLGDLASELGACGALVEVHDDGLAITPRALRSAVVNPHDDHRLAMSLALLGIRQAGIVVSDAPVVAKSWPTFWSAMRQGLGLL